MRKTILLLSLLCISLLQPLFAEKKMEVKIEGIDNKKALENAQNAAEIYALNNKKAPDELRIKWLYEEGSREIANALQPFGYYKADIKGDLIFQPDTIIATYNVNPGKQIPISAIKLDITDLEEVKELPSKNAQKEYRAFEKILTSSKMKVGSPLNHTQYESTKSKLSDKASELGYFDAFYPHHQLLVNLATYEASVNLQMTLGPRYLFGDSTFHQDYFSDQFLDRFVANMQEYSEYSDAKLIELQSNFNESGYFEEVVIAPQINYEDKIVPLNIYLKPRKKRTLTLGLGYSSDIGIKAMAGVDWHYINQYGHRLTTNLLWAQKRHEGVINYEIPGKDPIRDKYNIYLNYNYEDTSTKDYTTYLTGVSRTRLRDKYSFGYSLHYQYDKFRDVDGSNQTSSLIVPTIFGEWKTTDIVPYNRFGLKVAGKIRGSVKNVGADISFLQASIMTQLFVPITDSNRFNLRGGLGYTKIKNEDLRKLPPSLRFYVGGDNTVRGYKFDGIGVKGYNGDIYGGKKMTFMSVELEHKLTPNFAMVTFVDAGDAYNDKVNLKYGAGAGIRWYSPIGTVKLDLAHGFDKEFGETVRLHLNIGTDL